MTVKVVSRDTTALPTDLLALAKSHMRVEWAYDDAFIQSVIARAIARVEQVNEVTINPTDVLWTLKASAFCNGGADLPVRPASAAVVMQGEPPVDVSTDYEISLKWNSIHGIPIQTLTGAATDSSITLTLGFATAAELPPPLVDLILRHSAHLYEHREILIPGTEYVAPDLQIDATWWMPRA